MEARDYMDYKKMLRVTSNTNMEGFTEFEEDIRFDEDDPDFDHRMTSLAVPIIFQVPNMSIVGVHPRNFQTHHGSLSSLSFSLDDITTCCSPQFQSEHVTTIEELRLQMSSCFTCGVSWVEDHVSLDCSECGGYALQRPCPICDGTCGAVWKRDLTKSHSCGKARWEGECNDARDTAPPKEFVTNNAPTQELCLKLEKLSANS